MEINQWHNKRICFHPEYGKEAYTFKLPYFDPILKKIDKGQIDERIFTQDEFLEWLYETNDTYIPDMPPFEFIQGTIRAHNGEICLTAFVDISLGELVDFESACNAYHVLPFDGGLLDQQQFYMDAFNVIRGERNRYEKVRADKMMKNIKSDKGTKKRPLRDKKGGGL